MAESEEGSTILSDFYMFSGFEMKHYHAAVKGTVQIPVAG